MSGTTQQDIHARAIVAAWHGAANLAACEDPTMQSLDWATPGMTPDAADRDGVIVTIGGFALANPGASGEALYRYAQGQGLHDGEADGYAAIPAACRLAYEAFPKLLPIVLRVLEGEARAALPPAAPAAPQRVPLEETILDPVGRNDDRIDAPARSVTLAAPAADAAAEGKPAEDKPAGRRRR